MSKTTKLGFWFAAIVLFGFGAYYLVRINPAHQITEPGDPSCVVKTRKFIPEQTPQGRPNLSLVDEYCDDANGVKTHVTSYYRPNDEQIDHTITYFRPDQTQRELVAFFKDGREKAHAYFDNQGEIVLNGFEIRLDGSTIWEAKLLTKEQIVRTVYYWWNSSVFIQHDRHLDDKGITEKQYFRRNGARWLKRDEVGGTLVKETNWDETGTLVSVREIEPNGAFTMTYYRPDGSMHYKQKFSTDSVYGTSEVVHYMENVHEYGVDGKTLSRVYTMASFSAKIVAQVDFYNPDGSIRESKPGAKVDFDKKFIAQPRPFERPEELWGTEENNPNMRQ